MVFTIFFQIKRPQDFYHLKVCLTTLFGCLFLPFSHYWAVPQNSWYYSHSTTFLFFYIFYHVFGIFIITIISNTCLKNEYQKKQYAFSTVSNRITILV